MERATSSLAGAAAGSAVMGGADQGLANSFNWRKVIAENQCSPRGGINDFEAIRIGGIDQWINVRGSSADNPLLLWLHAGPGSAMIGESWTFQRPWEDFFTMVQWDQRGAGKTFRVNSKQSAEKLTIDRIQADAEELIVYLLKRYRRSKLILVGHSWGTALGLRIALRRPELLHAYVGMGQVANMIENEAISYRVTLEKARRDGNREAIDQLEALTSYLEPGVPSIADIVIERRWVEYYGGMIASLQQDNEIDRCRMSPLYSDEDVAAYHSGMMYSVTSLWHELYATDFFKHDSLKCPLFMIEGADDLAIPTVVARRLFDQLQAPHKRFVELANVAHYPFLEAPGHVLLEMVQHVRPTALASST